MSDNDWDRVRAARAEHDVLIKRQLTALRTGKLHRCPLCRILHDGTDRCDDCTVRENVPPWAR